MPTKTFFNLSIEKKNRVLEAAINEFAKEGYLKASITRIVNKADIAKGSFYQYFEDKDDLFKYIVEKAIDKKNSYINKEIENDLDYDIFDYLYKLNTANVKFIKENIQLAKISYNLLTLKNTNKFDSIKIRYKNSGVKLYEKLLKSAIEKGEIRESINVNFTANLLENASLFINDYFMENKDFKKLDDYIPQVDNIVNIIKCGIKREGG